MNNLDIVDVDKSDLDVYDILIQIHKSEYVNYIKDKSKELKDGETLFEDSHVEEGVVQDTPIIKDAYDIAAASFQTAVTAARNLENSSDYCNYAICRPPGHHAGPDWMGGCCYFNNAVGAVMELKRKGHKKVGLIDLDFHFGNGSSALLSDMDDVFFGSIHGSTIDNFPYKETHEKADNQKFIPFSEEPTQEEYCGSLQELLDKAQSFGVSALVVSIGYDIINGDPYGKWNFSTDIYCEIGKKLANFNKPLCLIQEGGYNSDDLAICSFNLIKNLME